MVVSEVPAPVVDYLDPSSGALIGTLGEKVGEKSGGREWPTPHFTLASANYSRHISRRLFRGVSRLGPLLSYFFKRKKTPFHVKCDRS